MTKQLTATTDDPCGIDDRTHGNVGRVQTNASLLPGARHHLMAVPHLPGTAGHHHLTAKLHPPRTDARHHHLTAKLHPPKTDARHHRPTAKLRLPGIAGLTVELQLPATARHLLTAVLRLPGIAGLHHLVTVLVTAVHHHTAVLHHLRTVGPPLTAALRLPGTARHNHLRTVRQLPGILARMSNTFRELPTTHHRVSSTR